MHTWPLTRGAVFVSHQTLVKVKAEHSAEDNYIWNTSKAVALWI